MNRASVILLCITSLAIFFMLKEKPKLDIERYENQIDSLQKQIDGLEVVNDSLKLKEAVLTSTLANYDNIIEELNQEIDEVHSDTKKKLDSINSYNAIQLQRFFSDRYRNTIK